MIGMCGNGVRGGFPGRGAGACEIALETDRAALAEVAFSTETNRSKSCGANGPSQKKTTEMVEPSTSRRRKWLKSRSLEAKSTESVEAFLKSASRQDCTD